MFVHTCHGVGISLFAKRDRALFGVSDVVFIVLLRLTDSSGAMLNANTSFIFLDWPGKVERGSF